MGGIRISSAKLMSGFLLQYPFNINRSFWDLRGDTVAQLSKVLQRGIPCLNPGQGNRFIESGELCSL